MRKTVRNGTKKLVCDKRFRGLTMETQVQPSPPHENGSQIEDHTDPTNAESVTNGKETIKTPSKAIPVREKRSRSRTPQKKKEKKTESAKFSNDPSKAKLEENVNGQEAQSHELNKIEEESVKKNGHSEGEKVVKTGRKSGRKAANEQEDVSGKPKTEEIEVAQPENSKSSDTAKEVVEMDALILSSDEPDPELQFDENSDMDSAKGSPVQSRCKTRRSHTRNIPTPKTPKSIDSESENNSVAPTPTPENLNDTTESIDLEDVSTRAETQSDSTRVDYLKNESLFCADKDYSDVSRERSLRVTVRPLSARKTIRPLNDSYRQRAFKNVLNKSDLNDPNAWRDSTDRIYGVKRKRSESPEGAKRFKSETAAGFMSYISSPLTFLKSKFTSEENTSTPKLIGYKDSTSEIHGEGIYSEVVSEDQEKRNRCVVM
ncbi:uncharacterized protein DDB_G0283697-like isoform X1 [Euwallacea similis]|uniref:uncharacterized protein DDB_G0283697-like isoform X1 n=2 Tax=Euwallacea similis TaxID=1736056 RepID=UPI00344BC8E7